METYHSPPNILKLSINKTCYTWGVFRGRNGFFFGRNVFMPVENQNAEKKDTHPDFLWEIKTYCELYFESLPKISNYSKLTSFFKRFQNLIWWIKTLSLLWNWSGICSSGSFYRNISDKVFKNGPTKICGRQPLKNLKWYDLLKQTYHFQFFKGYRTQISLGPFLNTFTNLLLGIDGLLFRIMWVLLNNNK